MAHMNVSEEKSSEELHCIQANHDEAYLYVSQGLSYQQKNETGLACDMYRKGIQKINAALKVRCDRPYCIGGKWDKARQMQQKMRKTLQMIEGQLESMSKGKCLFQDLSPPSYEEACESVKHSSERRSSCPTAAATLNPDSLDSPIRKLSSSESVFSESCFSSNGAANNEISEVMEIYSISDGVQLFFISPNEPVRIFSSSTSLHIYKFVDNDHSARNKNKRLPSGWLQVGNWTYPLLPGQSPALESSYGAFLFPDVSCEKDGAAVAVILPADIDLEMRNTFKHILDELSVFRNELPLEQRNSLLTKTFGDSLSEGLVTGAEYISAGLVKGASVTSEYIHKGATMLREWIQPDSRPVQIDPSLQQGLRIAKGASTVALSVSSYLASKLADLTAALGRKLAPHIREQGTRFLVNTFDKNPTEARDTMDNVLKVAAGGFQGVSTLYEGLHNAAKLLAFSLSTETVNIVDYKYGREAGEAANNAVSAVGNLALTTYNVRTLGVKSVAKRTAKDAGKAVLQDYIEDYEPKKESK